MQCIEVIFSAVFLCVLCFVDGVSAARSPSLAIARPFSVPDAELLPGSFSIWNDFPPCGEGSPLKVDLFLVFSRSLNESITAQSSIDVVKDIFSYNDGWKKCFSKVIGIGVDIEPEADLYQLERQHSNPLWVNGPNRQFERTIRAVQNAESGPYDLLYLMEMDSIPVQPFWFDVIMDEIRNESKPFTILGSKYRGDKWDTFFDQLPWSLVNHINGNAIYNLSHPLLEMIVQQLETESGTVANSIPYDYRIAQIVEEVQTGLVPSFLWAEKGGQDHRLPHSLIDSMLQFDLDSLIRETLMIGNYANTHMISSYLNLHEVVIHGANMLTSWDSAMLGNVSLAISDWSPLRSQVILSTLDTSNHPFTSAFVVIPDGSQAPQLPLSTVGVQFIRRSENLDWADLCTVLVDTSWFVMTNSYHQLKEDVQIMTQFHKGEHKPVISFMAPDFESCYAYAECRRDLELAQAISPGFDSIYRDFDFVFHTSSRNDYCQFLSHSSNLTLSQFPSATSYAAYLQKFGLLEKLYVKSDRNIFGSRRMFLPLDWSSTSSPVLRGRQLQIQNGTDDKNLPSHSYICSSQRTIEKCLVFAECIWRETQHSCYAMGNKTIGVQKSQEKAFQSRSNWVGIVSAILIGIGSAAVISLLVVGVWRMRESREDPSPDHNESLIPVAAEGSGASGSRLGSNLPEEIGLDPMHLIAHHHFEETDHGVELVIER